MSAKAATQRGRARQHWHALERLQERYWPDSSLEDLIAIRDAAAAVAKQIKAVPGSDTKQMFVRYRDRLVHVVYCPRYNAIRTVLP